MNLVKKFDDVLVAPPKETDRRSSVMDRLQQVIRIRPAAGLLMSTSDTALPDAESDQMVAGLAEE